VKTQYFLSKTAIKFLRFTKLYAQPSMNLSLQNNLFLKKLATGAGITLFGRIFGKAVFFITQIFLARFLGPKYFGLYAIAWTCFIIVSMIAHLGLEKGVIHFASKYWKKDNRKVWEILRPSLSLSFYFSVLLAIISFVFAPTIANSMFSKPELIPFIRLFSLAIPLRSVIIVASAATRISLNMKYSVISQDIVQPSVSLILILVFSFCGLGVLGVIGAKIISFAMVNFLLFVFLNKLFKISNFFSYPWDFEIRKKLMLFSIPAALAGIFTVYMVWVDRIFLGYFFPSESVGIYQAISQFSVLFSVILSSFNSIFSPIIVQLHSNKDLTSLEEFYRIITKWVVYITSPIFLVIFFYSSDIIAILFGNQYLEGTIPLIILTCGQMVNVATGPVGFLLTMTGKQNSWFFISASMLLLNIFLNYLLIPRYGLVGAALSTAISISLLFIFGLILVKYFLKIWPYDRRYLKGAIGILISALSFYLFSFINFDIYLIKLIFVFSISTSIFIIILFIIGLDSEDKKIFRIIVPQRSKD
jgi:O-antigen/teichoic acid export membrane protein